MVSSSSRLNSASNSSSSIPRKKLGCVHTFDDGEVMKNPDHIQLVEPGEDAAEALEPFDTAPDHHGLRRFFFVAPKARTQCRVSSHRRGPSPRAAASVPAISGPQAHRRLDRATKTSRRYQPAFPAATGSRWLADRFFSRPRPVWMHGHHSTSSETVSTRTRMICCCVRPRRRSRIAQRFSAYRSYATSQSAPASPGSTITASRTAPADCLPDVPSLPRKQLDLLVQSVPYNPYSVNTP